jgi:hypothetical protein
MSQEDEKIDISEKEKDFLTLGTDNGPIGPKVPQNKLCEGLKNKMLDLESQFKIMDKKMDKILDILEKDCKKMTDHIDFVENVYDNVKMPFYYVMDKVNYLVTNDNKKILDSEHNNNNIEDR